MQARAARLSGADSLLIKSRLVLEYAGREVQLVEQLKMVTDGDD
jgi:hypothetical protein